jgi:N-acetylglucosaminyl-diphospho-decaprenol L-rhamnosyltransferase
LNADLSSVTVVVVTYNSAHCIPGLRPLLSQCPHVVVSDNGSQDGTSASVRQALPQATVLEHGRNLGFGAANNRALAQVKTPFSLLLNPDCLLEADQLVSLLQAAEVFPEAAILAPQLLDGRGNLDVNYRFPNLMWKPMGPAAEGPACVGFVCGAAMLFRNQAFAQTGFFDEVFFLYYEDDDLCLRLFKEQLPIVVVPSVTATHHSRGSVKGSRPWRSEYWRGYHHAQSKLIFASKHHSVEKARSMRWRLLCWTGVALPFRVLAFSPKLIARMWGRFQGLLRWSMHAY